MTVFSQRTLAKTNPIRGAMLAAGLLVFACGAEPVRAADEPAPLFEMAGKEPAQVRERSLGTTVPTVTAAAPSGAAPTMSTRDLQLQKDLKFRELKRQLEILQQSPGSASAAAGAASERLPDEHPPAGSGGQPNHNQAVSSENHPADHHSPALSPARPDQPQHHPVPEIDHRPEHLEHAPVPQLVPASQGHGTPPPEAAPQVVDGTIDRFALATSLFGTGQVEVCLDVLKHTELSQFSREDQLWAAYMEACCHRRAGRLDVARQTYRRILGEKDADWIGQLARWWLDDLDAKVKLQADVQRLNETLAAWEAEIDTLAKQSARTTADE